MSDRPIGAARYLRMSCEHQRYSLRSQAAAIAQYAAAHSYHILRTYLDPGRSSLTLSKRPGLQGLLADVLQADRDFDAVLVLDVSRWGRFQDLDQSAHYEFLCRQAGVAVVYCAEPFENDGSAQAALIKELKRLMAAEFSRELSQKVSSAKRLQAQLGFRMGGPVIYGVERLLLDASGAARGGLRRGQCKALHDDHVILRHGPEPELEILRRIFRSFALDKRTPNDIAAELNRDGVPFIGRRRWTRDGIVRLLRHELMVGVYVYDRTTHPLAGRLTPRPPEDWVRVQVFDPIVPADVFERAQVRLGAIRPHQGRRQMLQSLQALWRKHGRLSAALIDRSRTTPCVNTYAKYFGGLPQAYAAIGYTPPRRGARKQAA